MNNYLYTIQQLLDTAKNFLWQGPLLVLLVGGGLYLTIKLKGIQFRYLKYSFALAFLPNCSNKNAQSTGKVKGDIMPFAALMTSLAGAIGTGSITGIATAIMTGGLGSLFWMWVMALVGMATAYSETLLSIKFRQTNEEQQMSGGPMYTLKFGLKMPKLAAIYAFFTAISAIGIGCLVQSNSMVDAIVEAHPILDRMTLGIILAIIVGAVILGGVKSIGRVASFLVPVMAIAYLTAGIIVLIANFSAIPGAFALIVKSAFTGQAAIGGFLGSTLIIAAQNGVQFGIFANEAGLGTLAIAGASSKTNTPAHQGMLSMCGVFISTMIICTITGLVIAVSGKMGTTGVNGKLLVASPLAMAAFGSIFDSFKYVVVIGLNLFAFTTILAWCYYGEKCIEFLFGLKLSHIYRWCFTIAVAIGATLELSFVWSIANFASALMTIPNLVALILLANVVKKETNSYLKSLS